MSTVQEMEDRADSSIPVDRMHGSVRKSNSFIQKQSLLLNALLQKVRIQKRLKRCFCVHTERLTTSYRRPTIDPPLATTLGRIICKRSAPTSPKASAGAGQEFGTFIHSVEYPGRTKLTLALIGMSTPITPRLSARRTSQPLLKGKTGAESSM